MQRITVDPRVRWGTPCLRDTGTSVAHVVALDRAGLSLDRILDSCPDLTVADVDAALDWHACFGDVGLGPQPPEPGPSHPRIAVEEFPDLDAADVEDAVAYDLDATA